MTTHRRVLRLAIVFGLVSTILLLGSTRREPTYQGRRLTFWLAELDSRSEINAVRAREAVRKIGQSAVPTLLRLLQTRPGFIERVLPEIDKKLGWLRIRTAEERRDLAVCGFRAIRESGALAIPALLRQLNDPDLAYDSERALMEIGPVAVDSMCKALANENEEIRYNVANALGTWPLSDSALPAVPALIEATHDRSWRVRGQAAFSLGSIGKCLDAVIPALVTALDDEEYYVRKESIIALGRLGTRGRGAVYALVKMANEANSEPERILAIDALGKVDPTALESVRNYTKLR